MSLKSATDLLRQQIKSSSHIVSFSSALDKILGGGVPTGYITEIAGESGIGKTQLCFQLCLDVQIPVCLGGVGGEAVYIDTENTFQSQRIYQMAEAVTEHCKSISKEEQLDYIRNMNPQMFLSGIYLFRCIDVVQLLAASHQLNDFMKLHPKVKLIVVDSIAQCIRPEEDMKSRMKFLNNLSENFKKLLLLHNIAVVFVNQVTTKFSGLGGESCIVPALGATWSYVPATKLMLLRREDDRIALLYKSPSQPRCAVKFSVTSAGFRDVGENRKIPHQAPVHEAKPVFVFSQATADDLMINELEENNLGKETPQQNLDVPEEDIEEKWVVLSQQQLASRINTESVSSEFANQESNEPVMEETTGALSPSAILEETDIVKYEKVLTDSNRLNMELPQTQVICQQSTSYKEPPSPVLVPRASRKRRRIC